MFSFGEDQWEQTATVACIVEKRQCKYFGKCN